MILLQYLIVGKMQETIPPWIKVEFALRVLKELKEARNRCEEMMTEYMEVKYWREKYEDAMRRLRNANALLDFVALGPYEMIPPKYDANYYANFCAAHRENLRREEQLIK
jgi:hypothetical protein